MFDLENWNATVYLNDIKYSENRRLHIMGELLKLQEVITVARQTAGIILILQRFAVQQTNLTGATVSHTGEQRSARYQRRNSYD